MASRWVLYGVGIISAATMWQAIGNLAPEPGAPVSPQPQPSPPPQKPPHVAKEKTPEPPVSKEIERDARAMLGEDVGPVRFSELDEADKAIRLVINLNGYLCAKPILVTPTDDGETFDVRCITNRSGKGRSRYLVNAETNNVVEI